MGSDTKEYQVVLSIFRGSNFVVKRPGGIQCKIIGKVNESILESKVFTLNTTNSDPDFNYQIAWKLNKKKFQELRLNRGNVKIECHQLTNDGKIESLIGFCLISIKDAIEISSYEEIDVKNSRILPLTGTKQPWLQYGPKLYCMLHFEDPEKLSSVVPKKKMVVRHSISTKKDQKQPAPLPPPPSASLTSAVPKFLWTVNNEMGYFQLGKAGQDDDLYIMNITLICVQDLRQLLVQKSPDFASLDWRIRFDAFGMTIDSDLFNIQDEEAGRSKQTYLGDKSTARIRTSESEMTNFLTDFLIEMKIETLQGDRSEMQGRAYVDLSSLTTPETIEIRALVDVLPEHSKKISPQHKPQLSLIVDIKKSPRFFSKNFVKIENIHFPVASLTSSKENLSVVEVEFTSMSVIKQTSVQVSPAKAPEEVGSGDKHCLPSAVETKSKLQDQSYIDPLENKQEHTKLSSVSRPKPSIESPAVQPVADSFQSQGRTSVASTHLNEFFGRLAVSQKENVPSPIKPVTKAPPGYYVLNLKFTGFRICCRKQFIKDWLIKFHHLPLSVGPDDKSILSATPKDFIQNKIAEFVFKEDQSERWELEIPKITKGILESPLEIFFHHTDNYLDDDPVAFANIPLGNIFTAELIGNARSIKNSARIYTFKKSDAPIKIGWIGYDFTMESIAEPNESDRSLSMFMPTPTPQEKRREKVNKNARMDNSVEEWRVEEKQLFKDELKQKEKAYFQMLASEQKKQKEESERIMNTKLTEIEAKKKELEKQTRLLSEKEEKLKNREAQLNESTRTTQFQLNKELDDLKLTYKTLEADKNTEIKSLKRHLQDASDSLKVANEKNRCLQLKIDSKDEEIAKMLSSRNKWPDLEALVKIEKLEQEVLDSQIEQHRQNLKKMTEERDKYRGQSQQVIKALQQQSEDSKEQLRSENENLKLQMLAAREHDLLNKERRQIEDVSQEIRRLQKSQVQLQISRGRDFNQQRQFDAFMPQAETFVESLRSHDFHLNNNNDSRASHDQDAALECEIERLTKNREGLLKTQAYTKYDPLVRSLEDEILKKIQLRAELQQSTYDQRK